MLCFEVTLNRRRLCRAGVPGYGVLTTILSWAHRDPKKRQEFVPPREWNRDLLHLDVGGLSDGESQWWVGRNVRVGDVISVRIVKRPTADASRARTPRRRTRRR